MYLFRILKKGLTPAAAVLMMYLGIALISLETTTSYTASADHPEQMVRLKEKENSMVTLDDVAKFAEEYIQKNSRDGIFRHYDKKTKKDLELKFDKVHRERLSQIKKDEYFICADFKGRDGHTYDLDFFVQGKSKSYLNIDKKAIAIHKVNGKENYSWNYNEKKGIWEKKTVKTEKKRPEHPEHPKPDYP